MPQTRVGMRDGAGEMWSGLSEDEKAPYLEQAEEDKERVEKLIQADPALLALRDEKKSSGNKRSKASKAKEPKANKSLAVAASKVMKPDKKAVKKASKKKSAAGADDESAAAESDDAEKACCLCHRIHAPELDITK